MYVCRRIFSPILQSSTYHRSTVSHVRLFCSAQLQSSIALSSARASPVLLDLLRCRYIPSRNGQGPDNTIGHLHHNAQGQKFIHDNNTNSTKISPEPMLIPRVRCRNNCCIRFIQHDGACWALKKRLTNCSAFWLRVFAVSQQKTIILSNKKDKSANRTAQLNHLRQVAANLYKLQRCPHQLRTLDCRRSIFLFWVFLGLRSSRSFYS